MQIVNIPDVDLSMSLECEYIAIFSRIYLTAIKNSVKIRYNVAITTMILFTDIRKAIASYVNQWVCSDCGFKVSTNMPCSNNLHIEYDWCKAVELI